jgi:hypothetical protein
MIRKILAFAILAAVALLALKLVFGILGVLVALAVSILVLAAFGYVGYLLLRVVSPHAAARVREVIVGRPARAA